MRTAVYIDGFNLYYGAVRRRPHCKWLDVRALSERVLSRKNLVTRIRYFTANISSRGSDDESPLNQQVYLRALRTIPHLTIHYGYFMCHEVTMPLADGSIPPKRVSVLKTEEKGSDVNLATYLLRDGFRDEYDCAVVISSDSDLVEPIRVTTTELGKLVGVVSPRPRQFRELQKYASFTKVVRGSVLQQCQFPDTMSDDDGPFYRPASWRAQRESSTEND
ncbi:MAG: NYN domain-containing protein [Phycisphaerales bacterium JB041]